VSALPALGPPRTRSDRLGGALGAHPVAAALVAAAVAIATFVVVPGTGNAAAYATAQILLVAVAAVDLAERRIPNRYLAALVALAVSCRAVSDPRLLAKTAAIGGTVFVVGLGLAALARGGLGMGDVKLAAVLGLLLGRTALGALFVGTLLGAAAGLVILARRGGAGRRTTFAYGPYLVAGAIFAILVLDPPALI
jgi:leader peptidase (prepilin peptidase)/N-methyltransferase